MLSNIRKKKGRIVVKVSIVEDENAAAQILKEYLVRYTSDRGTEFDIHTYKNGMQFLMNYDMSTDLVFMDIELPNLNGIETSARLREIDSVVGLVYVTNMAKYAIEGYAYHAIDYLLKPLVYQAFLIKMDRILKFVNKNRKTSSITLVSRTGQIVLELNSVYYVEVSGHDVLYHTDRGCFKVYGTLKEESKKLPKETFIQCNSCYVVNLRHISKIDGNELVVGGCRIETSRSRRKSLLEAFNRYRMGN